MADKKLVEAITPMEEDFAQWYTDVVKKAELMAYSSIKGCMIFRPNGYAIWESVQKELDRRFKETGVENVYMPMFIPESLLQKEKDHVEGFAPEVAWVTQGGLDPLQERMCVRPTSETLFCDFYKDIIQSYRDLPKCYNQWCSVVRWEKTTRPFLRSMEFLWQEGHTVHATAEDAEARTIQMLNVYADFCENVLAIPMIKGRKTDKEKFAGAEATYTIEALMHDGKALQSGTSHNFGGGFARAFGIQYTDKDNKLQYAHQTSWGMSTRIIGAIIMVHGDNSGLVLPPRIAPVQVIVVPVAQHKEGVVEKATGSGTGNEVSFEQIANWNPGVILFATNGKDAGDFYDAAGTDPTWASLDAIQSGSYYQVPKTPYNWLSSPPSVNQVLGMQWLPRVLYPGKFSTSVTDVAKDYYKTFYGYDLTDADIAELMAHAVPTK